MSELKAIVHQIKGFVYFTNTKTSFQLQKDCSSRLFGVRGWDWYHVKAHTLYFHTTNVFFNFDTFSVFKFEENKPALDQISDQFHRFDRKFNFATRNSYMQNRDMRLAQQCMTEATLISMLVFIAREYLFKQKSCEKRQKVFLTVI